MPGDVTDLVIKYIKHVIMPPDTESPERLRIYLRHFVPTAHGLSGRLVEWAWARIDWETVCKSVNDPTWKKPDEVQSES